MYLDILLIHVVENNIRIDEMPYAFIHPHKPFILYSPANRVLDRIRYLIEVNIFC
jgi:hypothetical protein